MKVIDLSEHNGNVNFEKVKKDGIDYVILRLGWIGNKENHTKDKNFDSYYIGAKNAGLKIGVYVFNYCTSLQTLKSGVNWTIKQLKNVKVDKGVFLDLEDDTRVTPRLHIIGKKALTQMSEYFCKTIETKGYKTGVYASKYWFENYIDVNKLLNYKIWLAEWTNKEKPSVKFKVDLWQYSENGKVNGISGRVDMNKCLCTSIKNESKITGKKTNEEIAKEVIDGKWGNGEDRKTKLKNAGYSYTAIQKLVNNIMKKDETIKYTVKSGDNLTKIAKKYNTTVDKIVKDNKIKDKNLIKVGQVITIKK